MLDAMPAPPLLPPTPEELAMREPPTPEQIAENRKRVDEMLKSIGTGWSMRRRDRQ